MNEATQFLLRHGYLVLAACVFGEQIGLPIHSAPVFMALGTLAASGRMSLINALALAVAASLAADLIWYELGRRRGSAVLRILSRVAFSGADPGGLAQRTFSRHRGTLLLSAKFVPGLSMVTPPIAGMSGMTLWRFLAWDLAATVIWAGSYSVAGYFFGTEVQSLVGTAPPGTLAWLAVLAACLVIAYLTADFVKQAKANPLRPMLAPALTELFDWSKLDRLTRKVRRTLEARASSLRLIGFRGSSCSAWHSLASELFVPHHRFTGMLAGRPALELPPRVAAVVANIG